MTRSSRMADRRRQTSFSVAFDKRYRERGVRAAAVHPGGIQTELDRYVEPIAIQKMIEQMNQQLAAEGKPPFRWKTIPQGAATSVWAGVVAPADEIGGRYCENCHVGEIVPDHVTISAISEGQRRSVGADRHSALFGLNSRGPLPILPQSGPNPTLMTPAAKSARSFRIT